MVMIPKGRSTELVSVCGGYMCPLNRILSGYNRESLTVDHGGLRVLTVPLLYISEK